MAPNQALVQIEVTVKEALLHMELMVSQVLVQIALEIEEALVQMELAVKEVLVEIQLPLKQAMIQIDRGLAAAPTRRSGREFSPALDKQRHAILLGALLLTGAAEPVELLGVGGRRAAARRSPRTPAWADVFDGGSRRVGRLAPEGQQPHQFIGTLGGAPVDHPPIVGTDPQS